VENRPDPRAGSQAQYVNHLSQTLTRRCSFLKVGLTLFQNFGVSIVELQRLVFGGRPPGAPGDGIYGSILTLVGGYFRNGPVSVQAVILAGGLGTRLRPLTNGVPKAMVVVHGKPFLEYQIKLLVNAGITSLVICIGHLGHLIREYFGDGGKFGVDIGYSDDGHSLLGTAGALKRAEPLLDDDFFLIYGDSYLFLDYRMIVNFFRRHSELGLMVVYRNQDWREPSNVVADGGFVIAYDKETRTPEMTYVNYGASVLRKKALECIPARRPSAQEELYRDLIRQRQLLAYEVYEPYYEVGSPEGLAAFERLVATGVVLE